MTKESTLVPLELHNMLTAGPAPWTDTRIASEVWHVARAVYGTSTEDDEKRVYRTMQATLWKAASQAPAVAPAQPKPAQAFLCRAWGESDFPAAELVPDWDGVRAFVVREWLGAEDATDYDGTVTLDRLKTDFDEHEEDQRGGPYEIEFEIGGVSIERVVGFAFVPESQSAPQAEQQADQVELTLTRALRRIEEWDECDAAFRVDHGSNGERDHYRAIARSALAGRPDAPHKCPPAAVCKAAQAALAACDRIIDRYGSVQFGIDFAALGKSLREALEDQQPGHHGGWPEYVAGVIVAYLGGGVDDERIRPIAGIIERRLWALGAASAASPAHQQVAQQEGDGEVRAASPTAGMSISQLILHVGGRNNAAGYVEFGSVQAVQALVRQVLRDLPGPVCRASASESAHQSERPEKTVCPFCESEWVTMQQHDRNLATHLATLRTAALGTLEIEDAASKARKLAHGNHASAYRESLADIGRAYLAEYPTRAALAARQAPSPKVIQAAQAVVNCWDSPLWRQEVHTAELIKDLRDAIAPQPASPECTRSHPHEGMNASCQEKSIQAQATNAAVHAESAAESRTEQQAELLHRLTESRQRQDAMRIGLELIALGEAPDAMTCAVDALVTAGMWNPDEESRARAAIAAEQAECEPMIWPEARDVGRLHDMSPAGHLRVGLDGDNDVFVEVFNDEQESVASVEFCNPGAAGGGRSSRTRKALIALMVAMEADNAKHPALDWWALRGGESRDCEVGGDR